MAEHTTLTLSVLRAATVVLGAVFLWATGRAWLRHRERSLAVLFIAVGLLTVGALVEGFVYQFVTSDLATAHLIEATVTLAAFLVLVWSLVMNRRRVRAVVDAQD